MPKITIAQGQLYNPEDPQKALIDAAKSMLEAEAEASACMRSEAVGETGMRERFFAIRQALRAFPAPDSQEA